MSHDRAHGLLEPGDRVLAAVSGGPDSVCLAHHLVRLAARRRLRVSLAHLHHGLRGPDADKDEAFVRALAVSLGTPLIVRRLPVRGLARKERRSVEDAGRRLRYQALGEIARLENCNKVATGHHLDDQAETLLLHLLRGTKAKGLSGMPPLRRLENGREEPLLIRPLLPLSRKDVEAYLRCFGLRSRTDRSNRSLDYTRNWIRLKVLPLLASRNPRVRENLAAIASEFAESDGLHQSGLILLGLLLFLLTFIVLACARLMLMRLETKAGK